MPCDHSAQCSVRCTALTVAAGVLLAGVLQGMLLHGPPGTGKTLIARQIGKMLNGKEPKVVNGPEVLSKYVGQAEENIRNLFAEAEAEYKEKGDASVRRRGHRFYCAQLCMHQRHLGCWP